MNNSYYNVSHSRDYYKGKSVEFAGEWTSGVRYFNDEYLNSLVVYTEKDATGNIIHSALLACKKTHIAAYNSSIPDSTNNQPHLIVNDNLGIVGIEPNDYWVFVSGSLEGTPGKSAEIVNTYLEALTLVSESNIGKIVFVKEEKDAYLIIGAGELKKIVSLPELLELASSKVDKEIGKGLSTNDFSNSEKAKLKGIEENAQRNIIEEINLNGIKVEPVDKVVSINVDSEVTENSDNLIISGAVYEKLELKQDKLIPGDNITIQGNVISAADRVDLSEYAKTEDVDNKLSTKQDTLTPGNGINIENNKISVTTITESETQPDTSIWVNPTEDTDIIETYNRSQIDALVSSKQDTIDDLDTIRERVNKGATALQPIQNITYAELVTLRNSSSLVPGRQYRITDYDFTTTEDDTDSAHLPFDIIVTADSESVLNESARAIHHQYAEGEEDPLSSRNIAAWKLKYTLKNIKHSSSDGKGTILWMKDESRNECYYDFINALFRVYKIFACPKSPTLVGTYAIKSNNSDITYETNSKLVPTFGIGNHDNIIRYYGLAKIVLGRDCYSNTFGNNCYSNTFGNNCYSNTFRNDCYDNVFGNDCRHNTFWNTCGFNTFGDTCGFNTFWDNCKSNTLGKYCFSNIFWHGCSSNTLGDSSNGNTLGRGCEHIKTSLRGCYFARNFFGDGCRYIEVRNTSSAGSYVQNYNFSRGLEGEKSSYIVIEGEKDRNYETYVSRGSDGSVKIYCLADIVTSEPGFSFGSGESYPYSASFIGEI